MQRSQPEGHAKIAEQSLGTHSWPWLCPSSLCCFRLVHVMVHGEDSVQRVFIGVNVHHPAEDDR